MATLARLAAWEAYCLFRHPTIVRLNERSITLALAPERHGISKLLFAFRDGYDPDLSLLPTLLAPGSIAVDVGANIGVYSLLCSRLVGATGQVYAFEPARATVAQLRLNIDLNSAANVHIEPSAVADRSSTSRLYHHRDSSRNSLAFRASAAFEEIRTTTLDSFFADIDAPRLDFIKVDVEGAEELVFRGALRTIERFRPSILFESNANGAAALGLDYLDAPRLIEKLGYEILDIEHGEPVPWKQARRFANLLARPK
jgi:FkbM family methyltransferase